MEQGGSGDVPTSPPCFSSLSALLQGQNTSIKRALLLPKSPSCSFLPTPRGAVIYHQGHTNSAEISKLLPAPAIPSDGDTLVTHKNHLEHMGSAVLFKISPLVLFQIKTESNFGARTATSTNSAKNCQHSARLSQWSVCVSSSY